MTQFWKLLSQKELFVTFLLYNAGEHIHNIYAEICFLRL